MVDASVFVQVDCILRVGYNGNLFSLYVPFASISFIRYLYIEV